MTRRRRRRRPRRRGPTRRRRGAKVKPLMVVELDADRLESRGLSFAKHVPDRVRWRLRDYLPIIQCQSLSQLRGDLERLQERKLAFDAVVIVGRADVYRLALTSHQSIEWSELGAWLAPLTPRVIALATRSGRCSSAAEGLLDEIGTLELVCASPIECTWRTNLSMPTYVDVHTLDRSQEDWLVRLFSFLSWRSMRRAWSREGTVHPEEADIMLQSIIEETALLVWSLSDDLDESPEVGERCAIP